MVSFKVYVGMILYLFCLNFSCVVKFSKVILCIMNSNIYTYFRGFYFSRKVQTVLSLFEDLTAEAQNVNSFATFAD